MLPEVAEELLDAAIAPVTLRPPPSVAREAIGTLNWPHFVVMVGDQVGSPVNIAAAAAGLECAIAGWVPHFSGIPPVLAGSDLLPALPGLPWPALVRRRFANVVEQPTPRIRPPGL